MTHPFSVGTRAVPNNREYWYMQSGVPRTVSGVSSSRRTARTNDKAETTSEAARVTWLFLAGVGSSSKRKKGFRFKTTAIIRVSIKHPSASPRSIERWGILRLSKFKYESYPNHQVRILLCFFETVRRKPTYRIVQCNSSSTKHNSSACLAAQDHRS